MSGGSQHNPNGRQSQLGPAWSPLQLQVANFLSRAPQAHMASERGVTWHTPTPPPHLYHVPAPSPPDPLQGMKGAGGNSVFRHTATPPELYRHTPTPPDKHLLSRHTPSPGDIKANATIPPAELYPHLGPGRGLTIPEKMVRAEELLAYARGGVDLTVGGPRGANGSPAPPAAPTAPTAPTAPALSVRDAPTINSLIARAAPHARGPLARVDALLERLAPAPAPAPASPHSVIVHPRAAHTPSPPSSNEDSADSCGAPPGSKRKRKPERTIRVPAVMPPPVEPQRAPTPTPTPEPVATPVPVARASPQTTRVSPQMARVSPQTARVSPQTAQISPQTAQVSPQSAEVSPQTARVSPQAARVSPQEARDSPVAPRASPRTTRVSPQTQTQTPLENGDVHLLNGPAEKPPTPPQTQPDQPHTRRKTRSGSAETIDDIAAMIASTESRAPPPAAAPDVPDAADVPGTPDMPDPTGAVDKLKSVLASPEPEIKSEPDKEPDTPPVEAPAAPRRRSARTSNSESTNVPVESPSEAKPAEPEAEAGSAEPTAASFVEVENQLEKMFAGLEEEPHAAAPQANNKPQTAKAKKRRKSAPTKGMKVAKRVSRASVDDRRKVPRRKTDTKKSKEVSVKDAYDSCSNASSSRSRGPYIQIVGPCASPVSVAVVNASSSEEAGEWRNGLRARGLHASTLGLRYDATTPDASWLCAFCERGPHARALGDLFGPYTVTTDCDEYRALDEASRRRFPIVSGGVEVWLHEACGIWANGVIAAGSRVWGLAPAVWGARAARCGACSRAGAAVVCATRACRARVHVPCAPAAGWHLLDDDFRALCPRHAPVAAAPTPPPAPAPNR
ncbi:nascent polypeptide-associated complex subunit alpha, muscle-specific form isoform X2 [Papilio machaon]|uniref:nascent polypeptide-associated complex subunit alpha, muscle-specific form isoform X2 n=1 Tax=Papilio machaon TaxID=76193 RepID=UPI001E662A98|nr:nascent polypeptide-associated complex subunit alpha, muscle-specific form isoform X2 [Papilio machaon]